MPASIDVSNFSPENEFVQAIFDSAGDGAMKELTGKTVGEDEKEAQRKTFAKVLEQLACLQGHGIVGHVLGELESAKTNREFLDAMKRIEPLIHRVRTKLTQAQILDWSGNAFTPLTLRQHEPTKPVSVLEQISGKSTTEGNAAIFFINRILPILGAKKDEIQRGAYRVGEGVYRDEGIFPVGFYGPDTSSSKKSNTGITNPEMGLWRGVEFEKGSKGYKLLKLCSEHKTGDVIPMETVQAALSPEDTENGSTKRVDANLFNILAKFDEENKPFKRIRKGTGIIINPDNEASNSLPPQVESESFALNADFLDQPLSFDGIQASVVAVAAPTRPQESMKEFTVEMVNELGLSEEDTKVLKFLMNNEGKPRLAKEVVREMQLESTLALQMGPVVERINAAIAKHTKKRIQKTGNALLFGIIKE